LNYGEQTRRILSRPAGLAGCGWRLAADAFSAGSP